MSQRILLATCVFVLGCVQLAQSANCYNYNGGYFYAAPTLGQTCSTICSAHGGFDAVATRHTGNSVGQHFFPSKPDGYNWMPIECSSVDTNKNWGATGDVPDPDWTNPNCYLHCACNSLPPNTEACDGDLCNGVAEGGDCRLPPTSCGTHKCIKGMCTVVNSLNVTESCGVDTQCRAYSCVEGECMATAINNNQPCTPSDPNAPVSPCMEYVCSKGECTALPAHDGADCEFDTCTAGLCNEGTCGQYRVHPDGTSCNDNDACTTNDVCSFGTCVSNTTTVCGQCSTCNSLTGCQPISNVTCDDGDDTTCDDTCQKGVCVGQKCPVPEAPLSPPTSPVDPVPSTTSPVSRPSNTPINSVVSDASLVIVIPHLLLALSALV